MSYEVKMFPSATALKDAAFAVSHTALYLYQDAFVAALRQKRELVDSNGKKDSITRIIVALESAPDQMVKFAKGEEYRKALRVQIATGIPADFVLRVVRGSVNSDTFNVNAISKTMTAGIALLSDKPLWETGNDPETLRGTILALLNPNPKLSVAHMLDIYMCKLGRGQIKGKWHSGGTQSSSSAHALSALGLVAVPRQGDYRIVNDAARDTLKRMTGIQQSDNGGNVNDTAMLAALNA